MKKLYEKNELTFAIVWIVVYCVLQSLANPLNKMIGIEYSASAVFCVLQTVVLFVFIRKNGLMKQYGLCKSPVPARRFLYYVPLLVLATGNLWNGVDVNYSPAETVCRIVCMLCVGFLEEVIFRGLLFAAIAKDNIKSAVIISSVTFGAGHLINLFNGSGMSPVNNLCQIVFAVAVGFLAGHDFLSWREFGSLHYRPFCNQYAQHLCEYNRPYRGNADSAYIRSDSDNRCLYSDPYRNASERSVGKKD